MSRHVQFIGMMQAQRVWRDSMNGGDLTEQLATFPTNFPLADAPCKPEAWAIMIKFVLPANFPIDLWEAIRVHWK